MNDDRELRNDWPRDRRGFLDDPGGLGLASRAGCPRGARLRIEGDHLCSDGDKRGCWMRPSCHHQQHQHHGQPAAPATHSLLPMDACIGSCCRAPSRCTRLRPFRTMPAVSRIAETSEPLHGTSWSRLMLSSRHVCSASTSFPANSAFASRAHAEREQILCGSRHARSKTVCRAC